LNEELQERSKLSSANRTLFDQIQQHKDRLEAKFSEAERAGSWNLIKKEFAADWNSLVVDLASLENQLCQ
jgi:hypothetical protein